MARVSWPPSEHDQQVAERRRGRVAGMVAFLEAGRQPVTQAAPLIEPQPVPVEVPPPIPPPPAPARLAMASKLKSLLARMRGQ